MSAVQLRPVAVTDLNIRYARSMGGNKITHYTVPMSVAYVNNLTGLTPEQMVRAHLAAEGITEVEFLPKRTTDMVGHSFSGETMRVEDISSILFENDKKLEKSLRKMKSNSTIYQKADYVSLADKLFGKLFRKVNTFISKVNSVLYKVQAKRAKIADAFILSNEDYAKQQSFIQIPYLPESHVHISFHPCRYLTVAFEEGEEAEAMESLLSDLRLLDSHGLILGHLAMPSILALADTVGSGKMTFSIFAFVFVDQNKMAKQFKVIDIPYRDSLSLLKVKNETQEGSINYLNNLFPHQRYEITEVLVGTGESLQDAHRRNYEETRDAVNEVVAKAKAIMDGATVTNKTSTAAALLATPYGTANGALDVSADIIDKNGKSDTLANIYKKNRGES